jgi:hypothetical protein
MRARELTRWLFTFAALYDGLLGALFLLAPLVPFHATGTTEPNHPAYVQFPAALLMIFALMFVTVALDPGRFRHLIPFGVLLKVAYCALAFGYWIRQGIPDMWKIFAVIDLVMGLLFLWAYVTVRPVMSAFREQADPDAASLRR